LIPIARAAAARGESGFLPMWAGQAARLGGILSARELTERLARDALELLGRRA
jgi:nitronate monooxygenase